MKSQRTSVVTCLLYKRSFFEHHNAFLESYKNTSRASAARALCALFILFSCCLSLLAMATAATPKLTDKGGEEIRIGCRVAEADFSYGSALVFFGVVSGVKKQTDE